MKMLVRAAALAAAVAVMSSAAQAASVAHAGCGSLGEAGGLGSAGGFACAGGGAPTDVASPPVDWTSAATVPASYRVMRGNPLGSAAVAFACSLAPTGHDLAAVVVDIE